MYVRLQYALGVALLALVAGGACLAAEPGNLQLNVTDLEGNSFQLWKAHIVPKAAGDKPAGDAEGLKLKLGAGEITLVWDNVKSIKMGGGLFSRGNKDGTADITIFMKDGNKNRMHGELTSYVLVGETHLGKYKVPLNEVKEITVLSADRTAGHDCEEK